MKQLRSSTFKSALALALAAGITAVSNDGRAATATSNATAEVIGPIGIIKDVDLDFGSFAASTGGSVTIAADGTRTAGGAVVLSALNAGNAASFSVSGSANATYTITLPASTTLTRSTGTETMTVDTFTSNPSGTGTLDGGGAQTLTVGATLTVASGQVVGTYTGTFDVTVEYN